MNIHGVTYFRFCCIAENNTNNNLLKDNAEFDDLCQSVDEYA